MNIDARLNIYQTSTTNRQQFSAQAGRTQTGVAGSAEPVTKVAEIQKTDNRLNQQSFQAQLSARNDNFMGPADLQKGQRVNIIV